jgi:hypothetical protein
MVKPAFANILTYKINATELVLEFGAFFPMPGGREVTNETDTHTAIVMSASALEAFESAIAVMKAGRDLAIKQVPEEQKRSGSHPNPKKGLKA